MSTAKSHFTAALALLLSLTGLAQTDALRLRIDGNSYSDETIVRFADGATEGYDSNYDAWKLFSLNTQVPSLYTQIDSVSPLSINALPMLDHKMTIGIYADINVAGTYTITPAELGPFQPGVCITLEDAVTGSYFDMRSGQSPSFNLTVGNNNNQPRFWLHVITPLSFIATNASCFGSFSGEAIITKAGCTGWSYTLTDDEGNVIGAQPAVNGSDTVTGLAAGSYNVTATAPFGCSEISSFSITEPASMEPSIVCDTVSYLSQASIQFNGNATGATAVTWDFGDGSPVSSLASPMHTYTSAGTYNVIFTADNGTCAESAVRSISIIPDPVITSAGDLSGLSPVIYSSGNMLVMDHFSEGQIQLAVHNMLGQMVMTEAVNAAPGKTFVRSQLPAGYYMVTVTSRGEQHFKKVFITGG